jgi:trans-aconitate 2-methyltransferase
MWCQYLDVKRNGVRRMWDPAQYLSFADERSRPFFDLAGRIGATEPRYVVDLGCGPGQLTATLADRWPDAIVDGIDSSPEMISAAEQMLAGAERALGPGAASVAAPVAADTAGAAAAATAGGRLNFRVGNLIDWQPDRPVDVIVSNAVLQWVPGHLGLLPAWTSALAPGGWLAFQLPGNFDQPSHEILRELAQSPKWRAKLPGVQLNRQAGEPAVYLDVLARLGLRVDAWETTYLHVLTGADPVTEWYKGSGLRPVLSLLGAADAAAFLAEYGERVRIAYPATGFGTVLPFRRVFVVADKP